MIASSENTERIENEIRGYFGTQQIEFIEERLEGVIEVALVTTSSHHGQKFLFHKSRGAYRQQALEALLDYIREHKAKECTYTLQWRAINEVELHTSYFSAPPRLVYHRAGGLTPRLGEPLMSLPPGLNECRPV